MTYALHLGATPWRLNASLHADSVCQQAELIEDWGYDSFFLPETHFSDSAPIPDPLLLLAAVAARTRHLKLGTSSYLLPIRQPLLAAERVASLDQLSGGRLVLGLGRGFQPGMLEAFGVNRDEKRRRFEEILAAMLAAWRGEPQGDPERGLVMSPRPQQQPHPPLWIAAFGPKALDQAGALGLPYLASPVETLSELEQNFRRHRAALEAAGHSQCSDVPVMRTVFVSGDRGRCLSVRKRLTNLPRPEFLKAGNAAVNDWCLVGCEAEVVEQISHYRERLGMTHLIAVRPRVQGIAEAWNRESLATLASLDLGRAGAQLR